VIDIVTEIWESSSMWPTWPATLLLIVVCGYWLLVVIGATTIEFLDFDFDLDGDVDGSILDLGFVPLRFLNLGSVPVMLWISIFSFSAWALSRWLSSEELSNTFVFTQHAPAMLRDFGIAVGVTKLLTEPLRGRFDPVEPNRAKQLIGQTCRITTGEATETFGEAEYLTEGSPLKLTVRISDGNLKKGDIATIVDYSSENNIYHVKLTTEEA
jgi:hypothetical protein